MTSLNCPECGVNVDEHPASRCMDAWVAENVMGECGHYLIVDVRGGEDSCDDYITWSCKKCFMEFRGLAYGKGYNHPVLKNYSSSIAAAWEVNKKINDESFNVRQKYLKALQDSVSMKIIDKDKRYKIAWPDVLLWLEPDDFCRAAIKAVAS